MSELLLVGYMLTVTACAKVQEAATKPHCTELAGRHEIMNDFPCRVRRDVIIARIVNVPPILFGLKPGNYHYTVGCTEVLAEKPRV
jgi:hypothetical protein